MSKADDDIFGVDFPPLSPDGERSGPIDPNFVKECLSTLDMLSSMGPIKTGPHVVTVNSTWGPVFRTDFTINGESIPGLVDRFMCWRQKNGQIASAFAMGQEAPPLDAK